MTLNVRQNDAYQTFSYHSDPEVTFQSYLGCWGQSQGRAQGLASSCEDLTSTVEDNETRVCLAGRSREICVSLPSERNEMSAGI